MRSAVKRRKGTISLEEAKEKFNEYYNLRWEDPIGQKRGKLFDMMYQKKPKYTLTPGEPGSERYLLEEGPRTFDMIGVDHFPENEVHNVPESNFKVKSKGSTYKIEEDSKDNITGINGEKHPEIYGPRKQDDKRLFSKYFQEKYKEYKDDDGFKNEIITEYDPENKDKNDLVDIYWEQYRNGNKGTERKNKRKEKQFVDKKRYFNLKNDELIYYSALEFENKIYLINDNDGKVLIKDINNYYIAYDNILDKDVPLKLKNVAMIEGILIRNNDDDDDDDELILDNFTVKKTYNDIVNNKLIVIYNNHKIEVYTIDDNDAIETEEEYFSLNDYIEENNINIDDLIEEDDEDDEDEGDEDDEEDE
jgi:hypothetical protein